MISSAVPLSAIAEALDARLPSATSSQLPVLHRLRRNLDARCAQIEQSVKGRSNEAWRAKSLS